MAILKRLLLEITGCPETVLDVLVSGVMAHLVGMWTLVVGYGFGFDHRGGGRGGGGGGGGG